MFAKLIKWQIEIVAASVEAFRNCVSQQCFMSKARGIGYSFQLAITAPLYSITGYCIATAQSCPTKDIAQICEISSTLEL